MFDHKEDHLLILRNHIILNQFRQSLQRQGFQKVEVLLEYQTLVLLDKFALAKAIVLRNSIVNITTLCFIWKTSL